MRAMTSCAVFDTPAALQARADLVRFLQEVTGGIAAFTAYERAVKAGEPEPLITIPVA